MSQRNGLYVASILPFLVSWIVLGCDKVKTDQKDGVSENGSAMRALEQSALQGHVLWANRNQQGKTILVAAFSVQNSRPKAVKWDAIGYTVIPNWLPGESIPRKDYVKEMITTQIGSDSTEAEAHVIAGNESGNLPDALVFIPENAPLFQRGWDRNKLGAVVVLSYKDEPVFIGVTRLPLSSEVMAHMPADNEGLPKIVQMDTYFAGDDSKQSESSVSSSKNSQPWVDSEPPYELVPLTKALETGRLSGEVANQLSVGQLVHQDTMRNVISDLEQKRDLHGSDKGLVETLDMLLREAKEVRDVATHQAIVFDKKSGGIAIVSKVYTDLIESGFNGYGVVLPSSHWGYTPPFAREATQTDWEKARTTRVNTGRWAGAYILEETRILLPGFRSLGI